MISARHDRRSATWKQNHFSLWKTLQLWKTQDSRGGRSDRRSNDRWARDDVHNYLHLQMAENVPIETLIWFVYV